MNGRTATVYHHYKGGQYEIITLALYSETHEAMVVYRSLETAQVWVRPSEMFFGTVEADGVKVHRFQAETVESGTRSWQDRALAAEREVVAARKYAEEMRDFCSPHAIAADYAEQLIESMDRAKEGRP